MEITKLLKELEQMDPVAEAASLLLTKGVTEDELWTALKGATGICDPLKYELFNKFRDLVRSGFTINKHGKRWRPKNAKQALKG